MKNKCTSGFVYLWRDGKSGKFYLGSHVGGESDGYICGSKRMLKEFRKRPSDFTRRIIFRADVNHHTELKAIEQRFLDLIEPHEFGTKYYNFSSTAHGADPERAREWMMGNKNGQGKPCSTEKRQKISAAQKGRPQPQWLSEKLGKVRKGRRWYTNGVQDTASKTQPPGWWPGRCAKMPGTKTEEHALSISKGKKSANAAKRAVLGYVCSPETRAKISATKRAKFEASLIS